MITKTDFDSKLSSLNRKSTANKSKNFVVENELKKLKAFDSSCFIGKSHFEEDGTQDYLVFQPLSKYFKVIANTNYVSSRKSRRLSVEPITAPTTSSNILTPALSYYGTKTRVKFSRSCLQQTKVSYTLGTIVIIYIAYELVGFTHVDDPTLKNSFFGAVRLTKNAGIDKYGYSGYGIGFDRRSSFLSPSGGFGQNVRIFGADMSSPVHADNKKKKF